MHKYAYMILLSIVLGACDSSKLDIPDFDEAAWQTDKDGCKGTREELRGQLIKSKDTLKGLNGGEISEILGKPNNVNLADRNQKYFIYNISCSEEADNSSTLSIRFNAVGLAYEVIVY